MVRVWMGYCHANEVATGFMHSVLGVAPRIEGPVGVRGYPGDGLILARNKVTSLFLESGADYLWSVDTDIIFPPTALDSMLDREADVVSGLYRTVHETPGYGWNVQAVAVRDGRTVDSTQEPDVFPADAVGAGFLLIHRRAVEAVTERFGETWWNCRDGLGEDYSFCRRLKEVGIPIIVDQTFPLRHQKGVWV